MPIISGQGGGGGGGVASVTAADTSIVVGGTPTNPTVRTNTLDVIATDHPPAADWSNNSKKITGLANGAAATDAAAFGQIPSVPVASVFGRTGAVVAANGDYEGVVASALTGATAATRYVGGTASGAPAAGTFAVGDFVVAQNGHVFVCTVAGTPGTWVDVGSVGNLVTSVFGRTGAVAATSGDYTLNQIGNATADYSLNSHKITSLANGTAASDAAAFGQIPAVPKVLSYVEKTTNTTVSATTEAAADTIVTAGAVTLDGSTQIRVSFYAPALLTGSGAATLVSFVIYQNGSSIGQASNYEISITGQLETAPYLSRILTPAANTYTYSIRAFRNVANATVFAGAGGAGNFIPLFVLVEKLV